MTHAVVARTSWVTCKIHEVPWNTCTRHSPPENCTNRIQQYTRHPLAHVYLLESRRFHDFMRNRNLWKYLIKIDSDWKGYNFVNSNYTRLNDSKYLLKWADIICDIFTYVELKFIPFLFVKLYYQSIKFCLKIYLLLNDKTPAAS